MNEFDLEHLHSLVDAINDDKVLDIPVAQQPETSRTQELSLSYGDSRLLGYLADTLANHLTNDKRQEVLTDLRIKLTSTKSNVSLKELWTATQHCTKCLNFSQPASLPVGKTSSPDIVFVHDNVPSGDGQYEQFLSSLMLNETMISLDKCVHTGLLRCKPTIKLDSFDQPIKNCSSYLYSEIELFAPKLIITLGSQTTKAFLGNQTRITSDHGRVFWLGPWAIMPTYSIAHAMRTDTNTSHLVADLQYASVFCYS